LDSSTGMSYLHIHRKHYVPIVKTVFFCNVSIFEKHGNTDVTVSIPSQVSFICAMSRFAVNNIWKCREKGILTPHFPPLIVRELATSKNMHFNTASFWICYLSLLKMIWKIDILPVGCALMNATTTASQITRMTSGRIREITYPKPGRVKMLAQIRC